MKPPTRHTASARHRLGSGRESGVASISRGLVDVTNAYYPKSGPTTRRDYPIGRPSSGYLVTMERRDCAQMGVTSRPERRGKPG